MLTEFFKEHGKHPSVICTDQDRAMEAAMKAGLPGYDEASDLHLAHRAENDDDTPEPPEDRERLRNVQE